MITPKAPAWVHDTSIAPPYPLLRCPRCKRVFDNNGLHVCSPEFLHPSFREGGDQQFKKVTSVTDDKAQ